MMKEGVDRSAPAAGRNLFRRWRISLLMAVYLVLLPAGCWTATADIAAYVRQAVVGTAVPPSASPLRPPTFYANTLPPPWTHSCQVTLIGGGSSSSSSEEGHQTSLPAPPPRVAAIKCWAAAEPPGNDDSPLLPVRLRLGSALAAHISNSSLLSSGFVIVAQSRDRMAPAATAAAPAAASITDYSDPADYVPAPLPPEDMDQVIGVAHRRLLLSSSIVTDVNRGNDDVSNVSDDRLDSRASSDGGLGSSSGGSDMDDGDDWGITFLAVPHLRLVDSVVSDLPLSSVAPLLQCLNCTYLSIHNTTLTRLRGVAVGNMTNVTSTPQRDVYGAVHATRVLEVSVQNSTCSGVHDSHGFACLYLQQHGSLPSLHIINSTFENNSVVWPSNVLGLSCGRLWPFEADKLGLGVIVTAPYDSPPRLLEAAAAGSASHVRIQGSRFDGNTGGCGGVFAFLNTSTETSTLNWEKSSAAWNRAWGYGGVLAWLAKKRRSPAVNTHVSFTAGSNLTLNVAGSRGGLVFSDRGITFSNLTVADNSHVTFNQASLLGGAIFCGGIISNLTVAYSSTLSNNTSSDSGGAVSCESMGNVTIFSKSQVSSNTALQSAGGALHGYSIGHVLVAEDSELSHNTQQGENIRVGGGAISMSGSVASLTVRARSKVSHNTATFHGGAVVTQHMESIEVSDHSEMSYNSALRSGGGMWIGKASSNLSITISNYSRLVNNTAEWGCGALRAGQLSVVTLSSAAMSGNKGVAPYGPMFQNGEPVGGTICSGSVIEEVNIWSSNITGNKGWKGGFLTAKGIGRITVAGGSRLDGNHAASAGGAISATYIKSFILTEGSSISGNHANANGGAVYMGPELDSSMGSPYESARVDCRVALTTGSRMDGNSVPGLGEAGDPEYGDMRPDLYQNAMSGSGGAIYTDQRLDLRLSGGSEMSRNNARVEGGAVLCATDCNVAVLNGSTMEGNSAVRGGALLMSSGLANLTIAHNSSVASNSAAVSGGGVYIRTAPAYVSLSLGSRLDNNTAKVFGGALACEQGLEMLLIQSGSSCSGNTAGEGGGCLYTAGVTSNLTLALRSRLDANMAAEGVGGALHIGNLTYLALIDGSSCDNNIASRGGAISVVGSLGYAMIAASSLSGNDASIRAGALQAAAVGTLQLLDGAVVSGNSGSSQGGFLLAQVVSNLTIANGSTIRGNSAARGGAVYVAQRMVSLTVASSEMSGNSATDDGGVIYLAAAASGSSGSSRVDSGPSVWAIHGSFLGGNTAGRHGGVIFFEGSEQVGPVPPSPPINVPAAGSGGSITSITTHGSPASPAATPAAALLLDLSGSQLVGNSAGQLGGALALESCRRVLISGGSFQNNVASQSGGGVAAWGLTVAAATEDGSMQQQRLLLVNGSEFVGNSAARGGGIYAGPHSAIVCDGCSFRANTAWEAGAAVAGERCGLLALLRCTVANGSSCGDGGGVSSVGCGRTHLEACEITANRAVRGAGLYLAPASSAAAAPELAPAHGAAAVATCYHTAILSNSNFVGNRAERRSAVPASDVRSMRTTGLGGAVFVEDGFHRVYGMNVSVGANAAWLGAGVASLQRCPPLSSSHDVPVDLPPPLPTLFVDGLISSDWSSTAQQQQQAQQHPQQLQRQQNATCSLLVLDTLSTASLLRPSVLPTPEMQQGAMGGQVAPAVTPPDCAAEGSAMEVLGYSARSTYFEDMNLTALLIDCDAASGSLMAICSAIGRGTEAEAAANAVDWVESPPSQVLLQDEGLCSYTPAGGAAGMDDEAAAATATGLLLRTTSHHRGGDSPAAATDGPVACRMASLKSGAVQVLGVQLADLRGAAVSSVPETAAYTVTLTLLAAAVNESTSTQELLLLERSSSYNSYSSSGSGVAAGDTSYACQPHFPQAAGMPAGQATSQPCNPSLSIAYLSSVGPPRTGLTASGFGGVSAQINISNGVAAWDRLQLTGYPGIYTLVVRISGPRQIAPVFIPVQLLGCDVGESLEAAAAAPTAGSVGLLSDMVRARCVRCPRRQVGVVPDPRPPLSALLQAPNALREILTGSAHACRACPSHAACTGGPVVVPLLGYWHSAPGSLQLHRCPFAGACSAGYAEAPLLHGDGGGSSAGKIAILAALDADVVASVNSTLAALGLLGVRTLHLASCQQGWYAAGSAIPATLSDDTTPSRQPPVVTFNGSSSSSSSSSSTNTRTSSESVSRRANSTTAAAASLACCVLHGLPPDHPRSYVQQQCAEGYTGNLCAACQPGWTRGLDFQCNACSSLAQTIGLGLLAFVATAAVVLYVSVSNFEGAAEAAAKGGGPVAGGPPVGDILKVVVLHLQYFIIITRLDLGQPSIVPGLTGIMAALTGAEFYFTYSHACLLPNQDSAGQAFLTLMGSLVTPCAIVVACLLLWALRYHCMHRGRRRRTPVPLHSSLNGLTCAHSLAAMELILDTPRAQQLPETPKRQQPVSPSAQHKHVLWQDAVVFLMSPDDCKTAAPAAAAPPRTSDPDLTPLRTITHAKSSLPADIAGSSALRMLAAGATRVQRLTRGSSVLSSSLSVLRDVDRTLGLPQQLGIVLLVSVFVLYPTWAQAAFSVFSCYIIDRTDVGHRGSLPDLQVQAAHPHGYWVRNMNQECYSGLHARLYVPIGIASLLFFCAAPPIVTFVLLYRARHRLREPHTQQVYGFMYSRYRPRYYWYDSAIQLQTLALVAVDVFGRAVLVQYQALMLLAVLSFTSTINLVLAPVRSRLLRQLDLSSSGVLILTISLSLYFVVGDDDTALMAGLAGDAIAYLILLLNIALLSTFLCVVLHRSWPTIRGWAASAAACCCLGRRHSGSVNSSGSYNSSGSSSSVLYSRANAAAMAAAADVHVAEVSLDSLMSSNGQDVKQWPSTNSSGTLISTAGNLHHSRVWDAAYPAAVMECDFVNFTSPSNTPRAGEGSRAGAAGWPFAGP